MTLNTFNLPDVGEGLTEAEILKMCGLTAQDIVQRAMRLLQIA